MLWKVRGVFTGARLFTSDRYDTGIPVGMQIVCETVVCQMHCLVLAQQFPIQRQSRVNIKSTAAPIQQNSIVAKDGFHKDVENLCYLRDDFRVLRRDFLERDLDFGLRDLRDDFLRALDLDFGLRDLRDDFLRDLRDLRDFAFFAIDLRNAIFP